MSDSYSWYFAQLARWASRFRLLFLTFKFQGFGVLLDL